MASTRVEHVAWMIEQMTLFERQQLLTLLRKDDEPDSGVREPRNPLSPTSEAGVALEIEGQ
jgi:hypothetical protein